MNTVSILSAISLLIIVVILLFLAAPGTRHARRAERDAREDRRLTEWFATIKEPGTGAAVLRDDATNQIVLPRNLIKGTGGRHRLRDRLTSQETTG